MPHLLIAGTTGSGKSVGINTMILSILYRLPPEQCRFIMIDPKMLELSVYDGIPHLLAPGGDRSAQGGRRAEMDGARDGEPLPRACPSSACATSPATTSASPRPQREGEHFVRTVQTGFDADGQPIYEEEPLDPSPCPIIVVVIDEMADLMLVAGKDIEGAIQRLAQMARAAGIHIVMATQRPSVDVITGTIKANFPTRISFQVTSKIDSRTILGEQGAEQLLGQGDMLYMAGGGRITRAARPVRLRRRGRGGGRASCASRASRSIWKRSPPAPTRTAATAAAARRGGGSGDDLYDQAVAVVTRDAQGLHQLHPAPPADRLQPRRLADRADGAGRGGQPRQPRRQARHPGRRRRPQADADDLQRGLAVTAVVRRLGIVPT